MPGFQKQLGDIPTPVSTAAPSVDTSGAQGIQQLGALAGEAVKGFQKGWLKGDAEKTAAVVSAVEGAVAEKGQGAFNEQGEIITEGLSPDLQKQIARVKETAGKRLGRIANAVRQGATSRAAGQLETEATVRELVSQTPGFSQEIKQLARELAGFDPSGHALRQILQITAPKTPKATAQSKRLEEAQTMQDGLARAGKNVSLDTILGNLALRDQYKLEQETLNSQLDLNTYSVRQWAQKSFVERGPDLSGTMLKVVQMGAEGGITDPTQYVNAVIQQREEHKAAFRQQVAAQGGMETAEMQGIETQIDAMYKPLIDSVNNNKMGDILANKLDLVAKVNQMWGKQAAPRLTRIIDAFGPTTGATILELMTNIADPSQFSLLYDQFPALKELVENGELTQASVADGVENVISKILNGRQLTQEDLKFRQMTETLTTQPGNTALREAYVKGLGESGAPIRAVSILSTKVPRVHATPEEVGFMKDQFNLYVGTPATEDVPGNLIDGIAKDILDLQEKAVKVRGQVKLVTDKFGKAKLMIKAAKGGFEEPRDIQTDSMKRIQPFLDAVTQQGYAVDLGVDKNAFPANILERVNARLTALSASSQQQQKEE